MEWQPIETAPKDGTKIIVWDRKAGFTPWVYWDGDKRYATGEPWGWMSEFIAWSGNPTHWMPIPARPESNP